jgi:hypothetical protein
VIGAQYGQDEVVLRLLNHKRGGFFLDTGASDGIEASNSLRLEREFGWRGICVEPDPGYFALLGQCRTARLFNCCLDDEAGEVDFIAAGTLGGILHCYDKDELEELHRKRPWARVVTRPARSIREVLREGGAPAVIDYWSLDTEGSELVLLRAFPFDEFTFRVLTVEHNRHAVRREQFRLLLESRGFARFCEIEIDDCYVNTALGLTASSATRALFRR